MKKIVVLAILFAAFSSFGFSQAQSSAEDILRYFPQGTYPTVEHGTLDNRFNSAGYDLLEKYFLTPDEEAERSYSMQIALFPLSNLASLFGHQKIELPESMKHGISSYTIGNPSSLADLPEDQQKNEVQVVSFSMSADKDGEVKVGMFIQMNQTMAVFRYDDLESVISLALEKNLVIDTGLSLEGRPVYKIASVSKGNRDNQLFAYATVNSELLMATESENIEKMLLTGNGQMMSLLDDETYTDLISIIPDLGPVWSMTAFRKDSDQLEEIYADLDIDNKKLDSIKERQKKSPLLSIGSLLIAEELIHKKVDVYEDDEFAELAVAKGKPDSPFGPSEQMDQYNRIKTKRSTSELHNNLVILSTSYSKELIEAEIAANQSTQTIQMKNGGTFTLTRADGKTIEFKTKKKDGQVQVETTIKK